jgi:mono/diheme cytochrome c family protein
MPNCRHDRAPVRVSRRAPGGLLRALPALALLAAAASGSPAAAESDAVARYRQSVEPILGRYCSACHAGGRSRGGVAFDGAEPAALPEKRELWWKALKMLRADLMPPRGRPRPTAEQVQQVAEWVKRSAFHIDPNDPDPGRVTVRRLNRVEYRNTVRALLGVDYNTDAAFPADDSGHGFDNIGDVLSLSPLLLEKYIAAARSVVSQAVPVVPWAPAEQRLPGRLFAAEGSPPGAGADGPLSLSYYKPAVASHTFPAERAGRYQLVVDLTANETFVDRVFDYNKCQLRFKADGKVLLDQEYSRQGGQAYRYEFDQVWKAGKHELAFELQPLTKENQVRSLTLRVVAVTVRGPLDSKEYWVRPANYHRFFPEAVPEDPAGRRAAARLVLRDFAGRAYRRPVDEKTVDRLVRLAEGVSAREGATFEAGIAQAMTVILASPRFLFREEDVVPGPTGKHPLVDEYALASRLSYFLWSTMPDGELFRLARENRLRANLPAQVKRMLDDPRSSELVHNFVGQWLQVRAIDSVPINAFAVMSREAKPDPEADKRRARFRELVRKPPESLTEEEKKELAAARASFFGGFRRFARFDLNGPLRQAMRRETEMCVEHVLRNDRSLLELIDSDYTFLNERLAKHYGIDGVTGEQMRLVRLPANSPRGGVLTQGTVLAITSNPDRTSPVKRGLFVLDNLLGTPPPPPPDIPALEEARTDNGSKPATLREALQLHRSQALCASCHNRMDPLGLALENFNALGRWRDTERGQPIDAAGQLLSGESFANVRELKHVLATRRRLDFYRCLTEKLLMYALGRGLEYQDVHTVDDIVGRLEKAQGRPSVLLAGIIESTPFQKRRATGAADTPVTEPGANRPEQ